MGYTLKEQIRAPYELVKAIEKHRDEFKTEDLKILKQAILYAIAGLCGFVIGGGVITGGTLIEMLGAVDTGMTIVVIGLGFMGLCLGLFNTGMLFAIYIILANEIAKIKRHVGMPEEKDGLIEGGLTDGP